jgi:hypothetical protein
MKLHLAPAWYKTAHQMTPCNRHIGSALEQKLPGDIYRRSRDGAGTTCTRAFSTHWYRLLWLRVRGEKIGETIKAICTHGRACSALTRLCCRGVKHAPVHRTATMLQLLLLPRLGLVELGEISEIIPLSYRPDYPS